MFKQISLILIKHEKNYLISYEELISLVLLILQLYQIDSHITILVFQDEQSLLIFSKIYCVQYMYMWWRYSLLPKVTESVNNFKDNSNFGFLKKSYAVTVYDFNGQLVINRFKRGEIIVLPLLLDFDNGINQQP
ncbi:unnamed protein product [Paramecium sonneborni]|uniref:Uncharacterized protein n=1 Tax=Paramecium sonneborni TaxID=65129 RepID=A0A8S1PNP5_9CILI|nr:unnamed protein product [Paramecium sonneborni]